MKFLLRVLGTWFLGLALVLLIVDGAKTLAANAFTMTSFAEMWSSLHQASWDGMSAWMTDAFAPVSGQAIAGAVFAWPSWVIFGCIGAAFLILGRQRMTKRYIKTY
jgi:hypothetical protein